MHRDQMDSARSIFVVDGEGRVARALTRLLLADDHTLRIVTTSDVSLLRVDQLTDHDLIVIVLGSVDPAGDLRGIEEITRRTTTHVLAVSSRDGIQEAAREHGAGSFLHYGSAPEEVLDTIHRSFPGPEGRSPLTSRG